MSAVWQALESALDGLRRNPFPYCANPVGVPGVANLLLARISRIVLSQLEADRTQLWLGLSPTWPSGRLARPTTFCQPSPPPHTPGACRSGRSAANRPDMKVGGPPDVACRQNPSADPPITADPNPMLLPRGVERPHRVPSPQPRPHHAPALSPSSRLYSRCSDVRFSTPFPSV